MKIELIIKIVGGVGIISGGISGITIASINWFGNNADTNSNDSVAGETVSDGSSDTVSAHINQNTGSSTSQLSQQVNTQVQTDNTQQTKNDEIISFFVTSKALSSDTSNQTTLEGNYQCKFEGKDSFDCKITVPKLDSNKHSVISEFMQDDTSKTVTINDLKTDKNIFKVSFKKQETENKIDWTQNIFDVIEKTNTSKKFAKFDILFTMDGNQLHNTTQINNFIFKTESDQQTIQANIGDNFRCNDKECSVLEFSASQNQSDLKNLQFSKTDYVTSFVKNRYYRVFFNSAQKPTTNTQIKNFNNSGIIGNYNLIKAAFYEKSHNSSDFYLFIFN